MDLADFEKDPRLFLFTSLTAGSSHIITATSRMETILKANKIPFQAIDTATDEKARRLWQRRARERKLPGLVKDGFVLADLETVEEWNEFGELKENIGPVPTTSTLPGGGRQGINIRPLAPGSPPEQDAAVAPPPHPASSPTASALVDESSRIALPGAAEIAARNKAKSIPPSTTLEPSSGVEPLAPAAASAGEKERSVSDSVAAESGDMSSSAAEIISGARRSHRGSEVVDAPLDEIRKVEGENSLKEYPAEEEAVDDTEEGVRHLKFEEPEKGESGGGGGKSVDG